VSTDSVSFIPSRCSSAGSAAACRAKRVLPLLPGPVSVSIRTSSRLRILRTSASSDARPTNGVGCTGRFVWLRLFNGGKAVSLSW
jgi:hypothetical protein